ncbi:hypothetical protein BGZ51_005160, partial [Haplosporangium sp. Z 767]
MEHQYQKQQQQTQQQDLSQVSNPTEDNLTAILSNRFQQGLFYTRIASSVMVQLNPFHPGRVELPEIVLQDQVLTYKDGARLVDTSSSGASGSTSSDAARRDYSSSIQPPHVIQLATSAYLHMRRTGQDQSIIT